MYRDSNLVDTIYYDAGVNTVPFQTYVNLCSIELPPGKYIIISAVVALVSWDGILPAAINTKSNIGIVSRMGCDTQRTNMASGGGCNVIQIFELSSTNVFYTTTYGYLNRDNITISGTIIGIRLR